MGRLWFWFVFGRLLDIDGNSQMREILVHFQSDVEELRIESSLRNMTRAETAALR